VGFEMREEDRDLWIEARAPLSTSEVNDLPDSAFAYIEPGGTKDSEGKTVPRSKRHFPINDAAHVRNALARIAQGAKFGQEALPKVKAAAKKFGVDTSGDRSADDATVVRLVPNDTDEMRLAWQLKKRGFQR
jgi:hypothetical protein